MRCVTDLMTHLCIKPSGFLLNFCVDVVDLRLALMPLLNFSGGGFFGIFKIGTETLRQKSEKINVAFTNILGKKI